MKYSILMTVYDREPEVLLATLRCLRMCDLTNTELVIVDDGSHLAYDWIEHYLKQHFGDSYWQKMPEYEAYRYNGGANCPAKAFNEALRLSTGENLVIVSSDVLIQPRAWAKMTKIDLGEMIWTPYVEDTAEGAEYCGPRRLFPAPWMLACKRQHLIDVGGWDENYLRGISYEDNDVVGRLACRTGRFMVDTSVKIYHQAHHQPWYDHSNKETVEKTLVNREWTKEKWTGIPFDREFTPFSVTRRMHPSGEAIHECLDEKGRLDRVVGLTKSEFTDAKLPAGRSGDA